MKEFILLAANNIAVLFLYDLIWAAPRRRRELRAAYADGWIHGRKGENPHGITEGKRS